MPFRVKSGEMSFVFNDILDSKRTIEKSSKIQIKSLPKEGQQLNSYENWNRLGLVVQTGRIFALHARGPGFKSQRVHHFI